MIIVALATFDSELYVTFPGTVRLFLTWLRRNVAFARWVLISLYCFASSQITSLEASTSADLLSRTLRNDAADLFQVIL